MLYRIESAEALEATSTPSRTDDKTNHYRFSLRGMFITFSVVAVLLGLTVSVGPFVLNRLLWGTGPVWFGAWPFELESLLDEMPDDVRSDVSEIKAFCLGGMFDREYIWHFHLPEKAYGEMRNDIEMKRVAKPQLSDSFWQQWRWWNPDAEVDADFMVPVDPELHFPLLLLMYDPERELLFGRNYAAD